jgi:hypothetical protein
MGSKVAVQTERVSVHEIVPGDVVGGITVAERIGVTQFRIDGGHMILSPADTYVITRHVEITEPERGECAFCDRPIVLVEKGTGDGGVRMIMLKHGPVKSRCAGSLLTVEEAQAEKTELAERASA